MSIATEITRVNQNLQNAYTALRNKGVTVPSDVNSNNLPDLIDSISSETKPENGTGNWLPAEQPDKFVNIMCVNNLYYALNNYSHILYSADDGITWDTIKPETTVYSDLLSFGYHNGTYVQSYYDSDFQSLNIRYSTDGINWETANMKNSSNEDLVLYYNLGDSPPFNENFIIVNGQWNYAGLLYSLDGINWTGTNISENLINNNGGSFEYSNIYQSRNNGFFLAVVDGYVLYHSLDGINWTDITSSINNNGNKFSMVYDSINDAFILDLGIDMLPVYSINGTQWESISIPIDLSSMRVVNTPTFNVVNNIWVYYINGEDSDYNYFDTSYYSTDIGTTWMSVSNVDMTNTVYTPKGYLRGSGKYLYHSSTFNGTYTKCENIELPISYYNLNNYNVKYITTSETSYIIFNNGKNGMYHSTDGLNWTKSTIKQSYDNSNVSDLSFDGYYYNNICKILIRGEYQSMVSIVGENILYSTDKGISWILISLEDMPKRNITANFISDDEHRIQLIEYINGIWFIGYDSTGGHAYYSTDGKFYKKFTVDDGGGGIRKIINKNGYYVIVGSWRNYVYYFKNNIDDLTTAKFNKPSSSDFINMDYIDNYGWIAAYTEGWGTRKGKLTIIYCTGGIDSPSSSWIKVETDFTYNHMVCANGQCVFYTDSSVTSNTGIGYFENGTVTAVSNITWSPSDVKYADGKWIAINGNPVSLTSPTNVMVSDNGKQWRGVSFVSGDKLSFVNGVWYAYKYINNKTTLFYSLNGISWKTLTSSQFPSQNLPLLGIEYANGVYIAYTKEEILYSSDGKSFEPTDLHDGNINGDGEFNISSITYSNGVWLACRTTGKSIYSLNGINWLPSKSDMYINKPKYAETGIWVAAGMDNNGNEILVYSTSWEPPVETE